jgi:hypothetical protein
MLAKKGAELNGECHSVSPDIPISTRIVKNEIAKSIDMRWQKNWSATSSCRQSKYFTPWVDRTRTKRVLKLTRNKLTQLTSIATGHAYTGWHLYTVLKEGTVPLCECGKESQDAVHLYTCVDEIYGNSKSMDAKGNHDINSILNYFQLPPIAGMMAERKEEYKKLYDARKGEQGHAREVE